MTFPELISQLKKFPFDEIRKEYDGYFEFVVSVSNLVQLYPIFESYYGVPFKPAGIKPSSQAQDMAKHYGGIQTQQTLYYVSRGSISDCAMVWPWNDGTHVTIKMARGMIGGED